MNEPEETPFSRFFREATDEEKARVYLDVIDAAAESQRRVMESAHQMGRCVEPI